MFDAFDVRGASRYRPGIADRDDEQHAGERAGGFVRSSCNRACRSDCRFRDSPCPRPRFRRLGGSARCRRNHRGLRPPRPPVALQPVEDAAAAETDSVEERNLTAGEDTPLLPLSGTGRSPACRCRETIAVRFIEREGRSGPSLGNVGPDETAWGRRQGVSYRPARRRDAREVEYRKSPARAVSRCPRSQGCTTFREREPCVQLFGQSPGSGRDMYVAARCPREEFQREAEDDGARGPVIRPPPF